MGFKDYLSVKSIDEGSPKDEIGDPQSNDENNKGSHSRVDNVLELSVCRLL